MSRVHESNAGSRGAQVLGRIVGERHVREDRGPLRRPARQCLHDPAQRGQVLARVVPAAQLALYERKQALRPQVAGPHAQQQRRSQALGRLGLHAERVERDAQPIVRHRVGHVAVERIEDRGHRFTVHAGVEQRLAQRLVELGGAGQVRGLLAQAGHGLHVAMLLVQAFGCNLPGDRVVGGQRQRRPGGGERLLQSIVAQLGAGQVHQQDGVCRAAGHGLAERPFRPRPVGSGGVPHALLPVALGGRRWPTRSHRGLGNLLGLLELHGESTAWTEKIPQILGMQLAPQAPIWRELPCQFAPPADARRAI